MRQEGEWHNNNMNGNGSMAYGDGRVYKGEFFNCVYEGRGNLTQSNGTWQAGEWRDGRLV